MVASTRTRAAYFSYESRSANLPGLKLLVLSFVAHCSSDLIVFLPSSQVEAFKAWAEPVSPRVTVTAFDHHETGWSIKPHICRHMLTLAYDEVVWVDADIVITADPDRLWSSRPVSLTCVEDPALEFDGTLKRCTIWGLNPARTLAHTVNTCVLRLTPTHVGLVDAWCDLTLQPQYIDAQTTPFSERPYYLLSDQDLLEGLLLSESFADIDVDILTSGNQIIHDFRVMDYKISKRLSRAIRPTHTFVHGQGIKPWTDGQPPLYRLTSIYSFEARRYEARMGEDTAWMHRSSVAATVCRVLGIGNRHLAGIWPLLGDAASTWVARTRIQLGGWRRRVLNRRG